MIYRCILSDWAKEENPSKPKVLEGEFSDERLKKLNSEFYNIYFLPNYPSNYDPNVTVDGSHIDVFRYVFVDMDLKDGKYSTKEDFINYVHSFPDLTPSFVVDSGNGIHVYWQVTDLDAKSFLSLQRRLLRFFKTDEAVAKIYQLMRAPGYYNTKKKGALKPCSIIFSSEKIYTCEVLDLFLPPISHEDAEYCKSHYEKTYNIAQLNVNISDKLPPKFGKLLADVPEVKELWSAPVGSRSTADYRLGHLMFAHGFTKDEAASVLVNASKALERSPVHRLNYAMGIIEKIWTYELTEDKTKLNLSMSVREILQKSGEGIKGTRFPCWSYLDNTDHGFRLGQVIGLVAGSGVGKTAIALNMFKGFVQSNPDYEHFFVPLEQPANEIAERWKHLCGDQTHLHEKVHVISNYDDNGAYRNLSLDEIREYILKFQSVTGKKVGCVVIDHIGALKKKNTQGENEALMDICHKMKAFAIETNTMFVMQSQAPREKAGIGDIELDKSAAYGTVFFESYCDYLITLWQPLKRCYAEDGCPTVTSFKFCKIRHKNVKKDIIKEDIRYNVYFDPETGELNPMTEIQEKAFDFFNKRAVNLRKQDRKTEVLSYTSAKWTSEGNDGREANNHQEVI